MYFRQLGVKRVYYLSLEYLLGRSLQNAMSNLGLNNQFIRGLRNLGIQIEELYEQETDAGLGNGGLGRLAACFLDSLATMNYPAWGYGLRYKYGMFHQALKDGYQVEMPDYWLSVGNAWEIERFDVQYSVCFGGKSTEIIRPDGITIKHTWEYNEEVVAVAYDVPVPGYSTYNTLNMRLWSSKPSNEFDFMSFNQGDYIKAVEQKQKSETITSVLYPNDNTTGGKELRVKQQYFFVSATLQDIMRRFKQTKRPFSSFSDLVAIQLNDTHPALAIAELMRLFVDEEGLPWEKAWELSTKTFSYTNHTVLPEALEKWSVDLFTNLLPRHIKIIYQINHNFLELVKTKWPGDLDRMGRMSLIQENPKMVRMANLAIVGCQCINGVAELHSELIRTNVFPDFYELWPSKFKNVTNGVTPRRWVHQSNHGLSDIITRFLRTDAWLTDLYLLRELRDYADDPMLQKKWSKIKKKNKVRLAQWIEEKLAIQVSPNSLFDVQVKRFHEYKRQLLNILGVCYRYRQLKGLSDEERADVVSKVMLFGGKAAPGYHMAKRIIKLINNVAQVVNSDPEIGDLLKVVFLPNYCVSLAEIIIPASDISQHISTAGMEASGTSNMKFAMNGGLIIGTLDGANIEIKQEIGEDNMFICGIKADNVEAMRKQVRDQTFVPDKRWTEVINLIEQGTFGNFPEQHILLNSLKNGNDYYLLSVDFASYLEANERIDTAFKDKKKWNKMSILSTAGMGKFSSDRSIRDYANNIWKLKPCKRPGPVPVSTEKMADAGLVPQGVSPSPIGSPFSSSEVALERLTPDERSTIRYFSPNLY